MTQTTVLCADCRYELRTEAERVTWIGTSHDAADVPPVVLCYGCAARRAGHGGGSGLVV